LSEPISNHRILVVDDNPSIHEDFRKILLGHNDRSAALDATEAVLFNDVAAQVRQNRTPFEVDSAMQGHEALEKIQQAIAEGRPYSVAFVDVRMPPGWDGIETISRLWEVAPALQVVVCTAYSDYSWDRMSEKLGISDNLVLLKKPFDNVEVLQLSHALTKKWLVTAQAQLRLDELEQMVARRTEQLENAYSALRVSEERFSQAFSNSPMPQAIQTLRAHRFVDANAAFLSMIGITRDEVLGRTPLELHLCIDYDEQFLAAVRDGRNVYEAPGTISTREGELLQVLLSLEHLSLAGEAHLLLMVQDISGRVALEHQLRQSQKMEAVGQLAAGVAHDFNNLLTVIQGHASMHLDREYVPEEINVSLQQINNAADRAADLTRKLLTFSRRNMVRPKVLEVAATITSLGRMLRRVLGEKIRLQAEFPAPLPCIMADETSIEQVLMNLALNARDAMPEGGTITVRASQVTITPQVASRSRDARAGTFVCLQVTDTGIGMDEIIVTRIFEPFFTTKGVNKGTGMGLATVYAIVQQHEGWIEVQSAIGKGSTFSVYFPSTDQPLQPEIVQSGQSSSDHGNHTIFVVEDDDAVRMLVVEILQSFNYNVIEAETGDAAIAKWPEIRDRVDLLLTDMVMPGKANGLDVARHCQADKPELKVIYTSGYSGELFASNVKIQEGVNYLPKPYLTSTLTTIITRALESEMATLVV
jgi:two-component system, cell cycle sensor histidine kinase and response regulator CckA